MRKIKGKVNVFNLPKLFTASLTFILLIMSGQSLLAQGTRGTIRGTVTDPNQGVVTNATVKLIDAQKGTEVRTATTNENGEYQFLEIEPSTYNIVVTATNFAELRLTDITVEPNRNLVLDAPLSLSTGTTEVTVTAGAEQIDRETPTLGTTVENRRIEGLPLNGRNVLNLALLQPGVFPTGGTLSGLGIRVNGSRGTENNVTLDGANNNEVAAGGVIGGITRPDAVQEFRLLTSNFEAEFGRNTGSVINVVTRSGTSQFHGNARLFYRGTKQSAANFFDNRFAAPGVDARQPYERKEYGFNLGGPLVFPNFGEGGPMFETGKTFFFADYERRFQNIGGSTTISNLPTLAERNGDFSGLLAKGIVLYDPLTATAANPAGNPFPGNIIPTNRISPIAKYYNNFLPTPNAQGQALASNNNLTIANYFTARIDHNFNTNNTLNFTYNYNDSNSATGVAFQGTPIPGFGSSDLRNAQNYVARFTTVITPKLVNTFLYSYAKNDFPSGAPVNTTTPAQIGFTGNFVADPAYAGPPRIFFYDRGFDIGNGYQGPQARLAQNIQFQDSMSWVLGSHRLKFGGDFVKYKQHQDFLFINNGILGYSAVGEEGSNTVGDDYADFLIGNTPIDEQFGNAGKRDYRQKAYAAFIQDNWRATSKLSLSFGVRYEYTSPLTDQLDRVSYYRFGATSQRLLNRSLTYEGRVVTIPAGGRAPNGLVYVGDPDPVLGGTVPRGGIRPDKNNFAPRFGFAYSLSGGSGFFSRFLGENQTVIRGGIGQYYGAVVGDTALQQLSATGFAGASAYYYHGNGTLANPFGNDPFPLYRYMAGDELLVPRANPFLSTADILIPSTVTAGNNSQPTDPLLETPIVTQYNLTLERSFWKNYVLGVSYVGNFGRKLYVQEQINPAVGTLLPCSLRPGIACPATPTTANLNARRLNTDYAGGLAQLTTKGKSRYDSLEINFQKRISSDGLSFQLAYTHSKSFNDADTQRGGIDIIDQHAGWALSSDDHPNRFVGSFIYDLPFFRNTKGFTNRLVDGWSVGAIYTYQSGDLFSVANPTDTTGTGGGVVSYADLGAPFTLLDPRQNNLQAFNKDAFKVITCGSSYQNCINADGTRGRRGTAGRNMFRLDNYTNNVDAILSKTTRLWSEKSNLELRFEAFNLFNYTQFTTVDTSLTSATFGRYLAAAPGRIIQLGARLNF